MVFAYISETTVFLTMPVRIFLPYRSNQLWLCHTASIPGHFLVWSVSGLPSLVHNSIYKYFTTYGIG